MKKCKNITFCHFFAFGGPCDVQKWVKVYKVYVSWKPCLYSLRRHQKKWFLSNWGRTRFNRSAQGLKMANCTSFKILTHIQYKPGLLRSNIMLVDGAPTISQFYNVYSNKGMFLLLKPSDQLFHSPASFNVIFIALHTLVVARSGKPWQALQSSRTTFC